MEELSVFCGSVIIELLCLIQKQVPFNLKFNIDAKVNIAIYVYDMSGRLVHQKTGITNKTYQFGESLKSGIYFVNLSLGDKTLFIRLVKY